jgi:lysophospholipase L1-like esterase
MNGIIMKRNFLLLILLAFTTFSFAQQQDWAQFGRYADANKAITKRPDVVFMGNSITELWWSNDSTFFISHNYVARGISGQTSCQMLVRFRPDVINLHPKVAVILAGTNDVAQNLGYIAPENTLNNIISMCELAKANKIKVILCSVLPDYDFFWRKGLQPANKIITLNKLIKAYADANKIPYVDYHSAMKDERNGLPEKYSKDGTHPILAGFKVMEEIVQKSIQKTLK